MKKIVISAATLLLLVACGSTPEQRWAQQNKSYTTAVNSMNDLMSYCAPSLRVPGGNLNHPQCFISVETAQVFDVVRKRARSTLDKAEKAVFSGQEVNADFYLDEATLLVEDMLFYTTRFLEGGV